MPAPSAVPAQGAGGMKKAVYANRDVIIICLVCGIFWFIVAGFVFLSAFIPAGFGLGP
jgi:hypothetical protein